jgi:hypothetical protein
MKACWNVFKTCRFVHDLINFFFISFVIVMAPQFRDGSQVSTRVFYIRINLSELFFFEKISELKLIDTTNNMDNTLYLDAFYGQCIYLI